MVVTLYKPEISEEFERTQTFLFLFKLANAEKQHIPFQLIELKRTIPISATATSAINSTLITGCTKVHIFILSPSTHTKAQTHTSRGHNLLLQAWIVFLNTSCTDPNIELWLIKPFPAFFNTMFGRHEPLFWISTASSYLLMQDIKLSVFVWGNLQRLHCLLWVLTPLLMPESVLVRFV